MAKTHEAIRCQVDSRPTPKPEIIRPAYMGSMLCMAAVCIVERHWSNWREEIRGEGGGGLFELTWAAAPMAKMVVPMKRAFLRPRREQIGAAPRAPKKATKKEKKNQSQWEPIFRIMGSSDGPPTMRNETTLEVTAFVFSALAPKALVSRKSAVGKGSSVAFRLKLQGRKEKEYGLSKAESETTPPATYRSA